MTPRARLALGALGLAAAAAGAVAAVRILVDRPDEEAAARASAAARLLPFEPGEVRALRVVSGDRTLALARPADGVPGTWRLGTDGAEADRRQVEGLLARLAALRSAGEVAAAPDPAALVPFGLAAPRHRVEVTLAGGRTLALAVGAESPFDGSVYLRAGDGPVVRGPRELPYLLDRPIENYRRREAPADPAHPAAPPAPAGEAPGGPRAGGAPNLPEASGKQGH